MRGGPGHQYAQAWHLARSANRRLRARRDRPRHRRAAEERDEHATAAHFVWWAQGQVISPLSVAFVEGGGRRDIGRCLPGTTDSLGTREAKVLHQVNRVVA